MNDDKQTADNDFEYSRQIYHDLLAKGSEALEEMMEVARATEHPRSFEVLSNMMKNMGDINGSLMDLHKKKKDFHKEDKHIISSLTRKFHWFIFFVEVFFLFMKIHK